MTGIVNLISSKINNVDLTSPLSLFDLLMAVLLVVGFLWYGPFFSKHWMKEMGMDKMSAAEMASMKKAANSKYLQQFIGALIMAYVFDHMLVTYNSTTVGMALQGAFWVWLGFIVPVKYGDKLWGGKSAKLFFIDSFHYLVTLAVFALIFVSWK